MLWIQVFFYSSMIAIVFYLISRISFRELRHALLPVFYDQYWFMSKYLILAAFAPFLAKIPQNISRQQFRIFLTILLFVNLIPYGNLFSGQNDILWFITLFFTGNYIRLYTPFSRLRKHFGKIYLAICAAVCVIFMSKALKHGHETATYIPLYNGFTYFSSVFLFLWLTTVKLPDNRLMNTVSRLSPYALGVYLLHDNIHVRNYIWHDLLSLNDHFDRFYFIPMLLAISVIVFTVCILIERSRALLFAKCNIDRYPHQLIHWISRTARTINIKH